MTLSSSLFDQKNLIDKHIHFEEKKKKKKKIAMTISGIGNARRFIPSIQGGSSITICQERKIPDRKAIKNYYLL
jgi:hypothetical protein